jgi:spermidine synthase
VAWQIEEAFADRYVLTIDGVEIDPVVIQVGQKFFGLDRLRSLRVHVGDARVVLEDLPGPYDAIIVDAYRGNYIPFHLATLEFFAACRNRLSAGGVLAVNLALPRASADLGDALMGTLRHVPFELQRFAVPKVAATFENTIVFASEGPLRPPELHRLPSPLHEAGQVLLSRISREEASAGASPEFRDDRAPVELFTDAAILRLAASR